jgi:2-methylcitrate dehydratase PrpD
MQAFSTCISLLHCSEASTAVSIEKGKHKLYSSSLKMLLEEEVSQLIEAVTAEEKRKTKKRSEKPPRPVVLDPPFSPMGRV